MGQEVDVNMRTRTPRKPPHEMDDEELLLWLFADVRGARRRRGDESPERGDEFAGEIQARRAARR